jgi:hypothetical protein
MFTIANLFGFTAGVVSFFAYLVYIKSIINKKTKPSRTTWWIFTFVGLITSLSYYFSGAIETMWVPIFDVIGVLIVAILSIKYGEGGSDKLDVYCFLGSIFSLILWFIFKNPLMALILNLFMDFIAIIPTIKKSYLRPQDESRMSWLITFIANLMNFGAITKISFGIIIYPLYMTLSNGFITYLLFKKRKRINS